MAGQCLGCLTQFAIDVRLPLYRTLRFIVGRVPAGADRVGRT